MSKRWIRTAAVTAALTVPAGVAEAQTIPSPYRFVDSRHSLQAYATYVFTERGTLDLGPGPAPAVGIGYTVRVQGPFNFDARVAFLPTSRRIYVLEGVQPDTAVLQESPRAGLREVGVAPMSLLLGDASLRFDVTGPRTWYRLQPYALIGAGGVIRLAEDRAVEEEEDVPADLRVRFRTGFTGHVGGGLEWHATDRVTVRLDARDVLWRLHVPPGFRTGGRVVDEREWAQTGHISLGLAFRF